MTLCGLKLGSVQRVYDTSRRVTLHGAVCSRTKTRLTVPCRNAEHSPWNLLHLVLLQPVSSSRVALRSSHKQERYFCFIGLLPYAPAKYRDVTSFRLFAVGPVFVLRISMFVIYSLFSSRAGVRIRPCGFEESRLENRRPFAAFLSIFT